MNDSADSNPVKSYGINCVSGQHAILTAVREEDGIIAHEYQPNHDAETLYTFITKHVPVSTLKRFRDRLNQCLPE